MKSHTALSFHGPNKSVVSIIYETILIYYGLTECKLYQTQIMPDTIKTQDVIIWLISNVPVWVGSMKCLAVGGLSIDCPRVTLLLQNNKKALLDF